MYRIIFIDYIIYIANILILYFIFIFVIYFYVFNRKCDLGILIIKKLVLLLLKFVIFLFNI